MTNTPTSTVPSPVDAQVHALAGLDLRERFALDRSLIHLNHGSFGACPRAVLDAQTELRARMEASPSAFLARELFDRLDHAREVLGRFVHADTSGLVFVPNATTAVNAVLRSLPLGPGDEVLSTNMGYGAVHNAIDFVCRRRGALHVVATIPWPIAHAREVIDAVLARVTERTRVAVIDHITSPTALVFPIAELIRELENRGVTTVVDGAHAVGQLDLDLRTLGAAFYTSNAHKWLCAPKGAAFLYVREDHRDRLDPLVVSHGLTGDPSLRGRLHHLFDWPGTYDPTPYLCIPGCLETLEGMVPGGLTALRARGHALALFARQYLASALELQLPCPDEMVPCMASLVLPVSQSAARAGVEGPKDPLQLELVERGFETWLFPYPAWPHRILRVSAAPYNRVSDYVALAEVLRPALTDAG